MENIGVLDVVMGGIAIAILMGGLVMLFKGISSMPKN
jgi:hypothetical protein